MKKLTRINLITVLTVSFLLSACGQTDVRANGESASSVGVNSAQATAANEVSTASAAANASAGVLDTVTEDLAVFDVVQHPLYGNRTNLYVTVQLTKGNPLDYNYIVLVTVDNQLYGKTRSFHKKQMIKRVIIIPKRMIRNGSRIFT